MAAKHQYRKEEPSPFHELYKDPHEEGTKCASHGTPEPEKTKGEVPHPARMESYSNDGDYIRHHKRGTNTSKSSRNSESYETPGAEAIDHRPENPPGSSKAHDFLMSVNSSDMTAYEDKCTMGEPRAWSVMGCQEAEG